MRETLSVSSSPHLRDQLTTKGVMYAVAIALVPAGAGAVYFFGLRTLVVVAAAVAAAVATEAVWQGASRKPVTVADGSALVTGMLLAFNLPAGVPYWLPVAGSVFAIAVAKLPFGGLGYNLVNPALAARAFLLVSWPVHMMTWVEPTRGSMSGISAITEATPLGVFRYAHGVLADPSSSIQDIGQATTSLKELYSAASTRNLFFGNHGGCLGETSVMLLLVGAIYLLARRIISWRIPVAYIGTVALLAWIMGGEKPFQGHPLFHVMSGGLILGACFMATDMVTSPVTPTGKLFFGAGCGILTSIIRLKGGYPEGVCYSILLMNTTVPLIDKLTRPRILGETKAVK
ncbi:MAG TPA: RnfABCDGE type electron transport complex subunit D [bacterium]|nr:RnfABCDGE type electron transport complex subunit D [bacterium]